VFEDVVVALAAVVIYLQVRSNSADTFALRVFYSFMALFVGLLLGGALVIIAGTYGPTMVSAATIGLTIMVAIVIIEAIMLMLYLFFFSLMPPKYQKWLRFWWT
jgi:hypothetical protein